MVPPHTSQSTLLFNLRALGLLASLGACDDAETTHEPCLDDSADTGNLDEDPPDEDSADEDAGEADSGEAETGDEDAGDEPDIHPAGPCQVAPAPAGDSIVASGTCVLGDAFVADCRMASDLHRPCDSSFESWCEAQGASMVANVGIDLAQATCGIGAGTPTCDVTFFDGCASQAGVATCDDPQTCLAAKCHMPGPQTFAWCCASVEGKAGTSCMLGTPDGTCPTNQVGLTCGEGEKCLPIGNSEKSDCTCF